MLSLAQNICWPYIHRDKLAKASERKACTDVGKNLKPVIPHSKWSPLVNCTEPIEELQIHFGGPILNEKGFEQKGFVVRRSFTFAWSYSKTLYF